MMVEDFGSIFAPRIGLIAKGLGQFVLKFWNKFKGGSIGDRAPYLRTFVFVVFFCFLFRPIVHSLDLACTLSCHN